MVKKQKPLTQREKLKDVLDTLARIADHEVECEYLTRAPRACYDVLVNEARSSLVRVGARDTLNAPAVEGTTTDS